jgi:hypothetical protein
MLMSIDESATMPAPQVDMDTPMCSKMVGSETGHRAWSM